MSTVTSGNPTPATPDEGGTTTSDVPAAGTVPTTAGQPRRAALASFIGSTLEYYDFFIYGSASALIFSRIFFPGIDPYLGTILSMATIGVGYVVRPLAAVVIGHFGDRIGRQRMLVFTLVLMGVVTFLIGCLPPTSVIGPLAPILLVLFRVLQGVSAAGESTGAVTVSLEHAPSNRRAFYGSWVNTGAVAGILLASVAFLLVSLMPEDDMLSWGWRIPFWASIVVTIVGLIIRVTLPEPPVFEQAVKEKAGAKAELPLKVVFRDHWATVLKVVVFGVWAVVSSVVSAYGISYGVANGLDSAFMFTITIVTGGLGLFAQPLFSLLADKIGRKPVFITGNLVVAVAIFGYFWALSMANMPLALVMGIATMTIGYGMVNPLGPSITAEMFPTRVRFSGTAIASQLGLILTGFAPTIAAAVVQPGPLGWLPVSIFTAACSIVSALVMLFWVRETYKTDTQQLGVRRARS